MSSKPVAVGPPHDAASVRMDALSLPSFWEFEAPKEWRSIDFLSDVHLQSSHPKTFAAFREHMLSTAADAIFILGDLFEAWIGDDARHEGFEAEVSDVLAEAAAQRSVAFMAGNRDFLVGADLLRHCGVLALPDPTVLIAFGQRLLLTHGDWLCREDLAYQHFRKEVRTEHWRQHFLAKPLDERRTIAAQLRAASKAHQLQQNESEELWADIDCATSVQWMHEAGTRTMIHGHTHRPGLYDLAPGFRRYVLTDWELDALSGDARAGVLSLSPTGIERLRPASPATARR